MATQSPHAESITSYTSLFDDVISKATSSVMEHEQNGSKAEAPAGCRVISFSAASPLDNPEDPVSRETQATFNKVLAVYILTFLFFISFPTNIINMVVFWRHGLRERINLCLFCLAFSDLVIMTGHFCWKIDQLYSALSGSPPKLVVLKFAVNNMIHSLAGFVYVSGFLCTLIALERCLCVWSPLKAQSIIQTKTAAIVIAVGHVVIFAGHYVIATRYRVVCLFDPLTGKTMDAVYSSEFYLENKVFVNFMDGIIFGIILPGIYVGGTFISTVITVQKLRKMAEWRDQSTAMTGSGNTTRDMTLTRMLIGNSCFFIICTILPLAFHTALPFVPDLSLSGKFRNTYYLFLNVQQLLTFVNASLNFFVYYIFGTKFRLSVQAMFCKGNNHMTSGKKEPPQTMPATSPSSVYSCQ